MKLALGLGWAAVALLATACSGRLATAGSDAGTEDSEPAGSSSSGSGGTVGSSSGVGSSSNSGSSGSSGGPVTSSGGSPDEGGIDDASVSCGNPPALHPTAPGDIYCGYGEDGGPLDCLASEGEGMCCLGGSLGNGNYAPQMCSPNAMVGCSNGAADAGGTAPIQIQCNQVADCTANGFQGAGSCCLQGSSGPVIEPGCTYPKWQGGTAIVCEANAICFPGEVQICSTNADCPQGMTCRPGKWKIFDIGTCM